jgi:hypothetical protein
MGECMRHKELAQTAKQEAGRAYDSLSRVGTQLSQMRASLDDSRA